jgi:glycosyltransferase involved in cell wall biosynthesis
MESCNARLSGGRGDRGYGGLVDGLAEVARRGRCGPQDLADTARAVARNESRAGPAASGAAAARRPRVGWVTTWGTRCGIASYSRYLVEAAPWPAAAIFAERGLAAAAAAEPAPVATCWQAGTAESLDALAGELDARGIDAVVLQFNYGFFDFAALNAFLRRQASAGRAVVVICHSTTDPPPRILARKLADLAPGLAACDRVLVHSERDVENLRRIGITRNVSLFPHGIPTAAPAAAVVRGRRDGFTLATYGFCLPHKGLLEMVEAFAELARADATLQLKMVNAEYPARASGELIDALRGRVRSLGLEGRVTLVTDYLPDAESLGHLAGADLVVFPYQHTGESSSAAVRIGLAAGRPVAVTPLPIFADVAEVVHTLPGTDRAALVAGLGGLVRRISSGTDDGVAAVTAAAARWCRSRSYRVVSAQLHALLEQLGAGRAEAA